MKKAFGDYRRLEKGNRRSGSLWIGPDHLLNIETSGFLAGFTESYRRFDYAKIQAITYARTRSGMWIAIVMAMFVAVMGWIAVASFHSMQPLSVIFGICALLLLGVLISHLVRGPTCLCKLQTAVQYYRLKPVDRMKKAVRFVEQMRPLCAAHQTDLVVAPPPIPTSPLETALEAARQADLAKTAATPTFAGGIKPPWTGSKLVTWALVLLLCSGVVTIGDLFIPGMLYFTLDLALGVAAYSLIIAGLARATRYELPAALKTALWGASVNFAIGIVTGYGLIMWASFSIATKAARNGTVTFNTNQNDAVFRKMADAGFDELGWAAWVVVALGLAAFFFGLLGLPAALRPQATAETAPKPPPLTPQPPAGI